MEKARSAVTRMSYLTVALLILFVLFSAIRLAFGGESASFALPGLPPVLQSAAFFLSAAALCALFIRFSGVMAKLPVRLSLIMMAGFRLLCGAALMFSTHISPRGDFLTYYRMAGELVHGKPYIPDYVAVFPHVLGYPAFLSVFFGGFGQSVVVAQCVNLAISCVTVFLVYQAGKLIGGQKAGLIAALLWTLAPSQTLYPLLVCTEPLFTLLSLLCVILALKAVKRPYGPLGGGLLMCLLGALCAVTSKIRPNGMIVLIAIIIMLVFYRKPAFTIKFKKADLTKPACAVCVLIVFFAASSVISARINAFIDREPGRPSYGWNLFVGLNAESKGAWNPKDSELFTRLLNEKGPSGAQSELFSRALSRAGTLGPDRDTLRFFYRKINLMWGGDNEVIEYLAPAQKEGGRQIFLFSSAEKVWETICDLHYFFVLILCAWRLFAARMKPKDGDIAVCFLILAGTIILHIFLEAAPRYHYTAIPLFCLIAGFYTAETLREPKRTYKRRQYKRTRKEGSGFAGTFF